MPPLYSLWLTPDNFTHQRKILDVNQLNIATKLSVFLLLIESFKARTHKFTNRTHIGRAADLLKKIWKFQNVVLEERGEETGKAKQTK